MNRIDAALAVVFVASISWLAIDRQAPPPVVPATAPASEFSADRAMVHVRKIAERPHPLGSPENAKVFAYLTSVLTDLGANPRPIIGQTSRQPVALLASFPGTRPERKALVLCAHYDSRDAGPDGGPGAGDDASGVAAILETLRALKAGPPLENEVIAILTDGEERGFVGARAYIEDFDRRERTGLTLNFEARGSRGPSYMFETSDRNGWMIREFARAAPHPIGSSLTGAVYREMPNSTDFTMFKGMGLKGLNFAFIDGYEDYHRPTDTPENLDKKSLQHHGSYALALTRHFGNLDLSRAASEPDAIYFHAIGPHLIVYPGWLATPLMIATLVGFGIIVMQGVKRGRLTKHGLIGGTIAGLLAVTIAGMFGWVTWWILARNRPMGIKGAGSPEIAEVLLAIGLIAAIAAYLYPMRKIAKGNLAMGGLAIWLALTIATTLRLPGGSYVFLWPTLFGLIAAATRVFAKDEHAPWIRAIDYIASIPAIVILPPTLQSLCVALGPNLPWVPAIFAGLLVVALVPMLAKVGALCGLRAG